jgi:hypothetical protein
VGVEGGGGNYGPNSGGYDQLGFTTLTCSLPASTANPAPSGVTASVTGPAVTLSWWGSANATGYTVSRASARSGPFKIVARVPANSYTDSATVPGRTYFYIVSSIGPHGAGGNSKPISATPDTQLTGTVIGTPGSYYRWPTGGGQTIANAFDGCLRSYGNFFDGPDASGDWLGLDFGAGSAPVVDEVKVCPRAGFAGRMVGGLIQGSNTPDFSSGVTTLTTITSAPADDGTLTALTFHNATPFRYVRYLGPQNGHCNICEIQFFGRAGDKLTRRLQTP